MFRRDQMGLKLFVVPIREVKDHDEVIAKKQILLQVYHLNLTFPLEDYDEYYQACPGG